MHILGLCFAGTATDNRDQMRRFVSDVLGLSSVTVEGVEADWFEMADGSAFAVASPRGLGDTGRSIGFLVENLDEALDELREHGIEVDDETSSNAATRYVHFVAPDGRLYELVERLPAL